MINIRRYNPVLKDRLVQMIRINDTDGLMKVLSSLSVAEKRTAGYYLSEQILPSLSSDVYWDLFLHLVPSDSKAYLGTFLKAAQQLLNKDALMVNSDVLRKFSLTATNIDIVKFSTVFFSTSIHVEQIDDIVSILFANNRPLAIVQLINAGTIASYFVLFRTLKNLDCSTNDLRSYVISLMKSNKPYAFNMASILVQYFDLSEIPGFFSLKLHPYELSRLDLNYVTFVKILKH